MKREITEESKTTQSDKSGFTKVKLAEGVEVQVKMNPNAAIAGTDYDQTVTQRHSYREIVYARQGGASVDAQYEVVKGDPLNGGPEKWRDTVHHVWNKDGVFSVITFSSFTGVIQKTLNEKVGLKGCDYLVVDISACFYDKNKQPTYKLTQNPDKPNDKLVIIVSGTPPNSGCVTKGDPNYHFDWLRNTLMKLGHSGDMRLMTFTDDDPRQVAGFGAFLNRVHGSGSAMPEKGILALTDGRGQHVDTLKTQFDKIVASTASASVSTISPVEEKSKDSVREKEVSISISGSTTPPATAATSVATDTVTKSEVSAVSTTVPVTVFGTSASQASKESTTKAAIEVERSKVADVTTTTLSLSASTTSSSGA